MESVCPETHDDIIFSRDIPKGCWNRGCERNFKKIVNYLRKPKNTLVEWQDQRLETHCL